MKIPKFVWLIALFAAVWFFGLGLLGLTATGIIGAAAITAIIVGVLAAIKVWKLFPVNIALIIVVVGVIGLFYVGALNLSMLGNINAPASLSGGTIGGGTGATVGAASASSCMDSVSPEIKGTSSTLTVNEYDKANSTYPKVSFPIYYFLGVSSPAEVNAQTPFASSTGSVTVPVGTQVLLVGENTSAYALPKTLCVNTQAQTTVLDVYNIANDTDLVTTCYDSSGTVLTSGIANISDYTMAMGASEQTVVKCKLKLNKADKAFRLGALATLVTTNMSSAIPADSSVFDLNPISPLFLSNQNVVFNESSGMNSSQTYKAYKLNTPVLLTQFQEVTYDINIKASSNDPNGGIANATTLIGPSQVNILWLDSQFERGSDGKLYDDIYDHQSTENTVGMSENVTSAIGKTGGAAIRIT